MTKPLVAIVGRPNVGKSTFFNRMSGSKIAIIEDTPGVTRDRIYADSSWLNHEFTLIDTGGIDMNAEDVILKQMREQANIAIENADVISLVTDVRIGVTAADKQVADMLLRSGRPVVLAVNKCDTPGDPPAEFYEFYNLGVGEPMAVSSLHGLGTGDLLDECMKYFPEEQDDGKDGGVINVAVIGKPNAGKSSLVNRILGEQRVIVSNVPGTTRDAIDTYYECRQGKYNFIDTAGLRKQSKVDENIEKYSVLRTSMAVERADVCLILIDANDGVTEQDTKVAGLAHEAGKASIIVVNKWDAIEKTTKTLENMEKDIRRDLSYMTYAPVVFISALTGQRVNRLFDMINSVYEQTNRRVTTGQLNNILSDAQVRMQPPTKKGKRLKIYYMTQTGTCPPNFVAFCNDAELFHFSYQRYIENRIREVYGFEGTPIRMVIKQRGEE